MDEVTVNHISCSLVTVNYVFSLFYVLIIMYPKGVALTLEFIQRYVLTKFFVHFIVLLSFAMPCQNDMMHFFVFATGACWVLIQNVGLNQK